MTNRVYVYNVATMLPPEVARWLRYKYQRLIITHVDFRFVNEQNIVGMVEVSVVYPLDGNRRIRVETLFDLRPLRAPHGIDLYHLTEQVGEQLAVEIDNHILAIDGLPARELRAAGLPVPEPFRRAMAQCNFSLFRTPADADQQQAAERAEALLLEHLDETQKGSYLSTGSFICVGSVTGDLYTIKKGRSINIEVNGRKACIVPESYLPTADIMLGQKFIIELEEAVFLENVIWWDESTLPSLFWNQS